ncbi:hypothetical protein HYH03_015811 [Edaphochlamys debaryana]|uniref:Protein kinase domain-containing protein n=1 Tax=Edaphochlamys debaryana TaxID=47281 RepID=A0A835XKC4_9CHLO|nr:hypothetical protein HYH03_015811 [Edaphochlamys debaryana]|eukprot:KAG2485431.1 hypothetical protein HYH03_015811 [Edaphochlamys debaryana]
MKIMKLVLREVRVLRSLDHPAVVKLLDAFRSKTGRVYMVFPYVGPSAYQALDASPGGLPAAQMKLMAWQVAQALTHLHSKRIVNRDIKPANIRLGEGGSVKLCDFGFARGTHCGPRDAERLSSYVVTRWYRAPEILVGDSYGPASDIWSLGCTLAELATGTPLFPGRSSADQLWRIMRRFGPLTPQQAARAANDPRLTSKGLTQPPPGRTLRERLPQNKVDPGLFHLIEACLCMEPSCRPTAEEILDLPYFWSVPHLIRGTPLEGEYRGVPTGRRCGPVMRALPQPLQEREQMQDWGQEERPPQEPELERQPEQERTDGQSAPSLKPLPSQGVEEQQDKDGDMHLALAAGDTAQDGGSAPPSGKPSPALVAAVALCPAGESLRLVATGLAAAESMANKALQVSPTAAPATAASGATAEAAATAAATAVATSARPRRVLCMPAALSGTNATAEQVAAASAPAGAAEASSAAGALVSPAVPPGGSPTGTSVEHIGSFQPYDAALSLVSPQSNGLRYPAPYLPHRVTAALGRNQRAGSAAPRGSAPHVMGSPLGFSTSSSWRGADAAAAPSASGGRSSSHASAAIMQAAASAAAAAAAMVTATSRWMSAAGTAAAPAAAAGAGPSARLSLAGAAALATSASGCGSMCLLSSHLSSSLMDATTCTVAGGASAMSSVLGRVDTSCFERWPAAYASSAAMARMRSGVPAPCAGANRAAGANFAFGSNSGAGSYAPELSSHASIGFPFRSPCVPEYDICPAAATVSSPPPPGAAARDAAAGAVASAGQVAVSFARRRAAAAVLAAAAARTSGGGTPGELGGVPVLVPVCVDAAEICSARAIATSSPGGAGAKPPSLAARPRQAPAVLNHCRSYNATTYATVGPAVPTTAAAEGSAAPPGLGSSHSSRGLGRPVPEDTPLVPDHLLRTMPASTVGRLAWRTSPQHPPSARQSSAGGSLTVAAGLAGGSSSFARQALLADLAAAGPGPAAGASVLEHMAGLGAAVLGSRPGSMTRRQAGRSMSGAGGGAVGSAAGGFSNARSGPASSKEAAAPADAERAVPPPAPLAPSHSRPRSRISGALSASQSAGSAGFGLGPGLGGSGSRAQATDWASPQQSRGVAPSSDTDCAMPHSDANAASVGCWGRPSVQAVVQREDAAAGAAPRVEGRRGFKALLRRVLRGMGGAPKRANSQTA